jgi:hypothetical protein
MVDMRNKKNTEMLEPEKNYREGENEKRRRMEGNKVKEDR